MRSIRVLHLSDLHLTQYHRHGVEPLPALCKKLERLRDEQDSHIDLIIMSGDLANKGSGEYNPVTQFLNHLCDVTELTRERVFLVPGNHDVMRKKCDRNIYPLLVDKLKTNPVMDLEDKQRKCFSPGFAQYSNFAKSYLLTHNNPMQIPGYSVADIKISDIKFKLVGVNSALIAGSDDDTKRRDQQNRIVMIDKLQTMFSTDEDIINLVVSHYPLLWIHESERNNFRHYLQNANAVLFTGHMHAPAIYNTNYGNQLQTLELGVGAVLGTQWNGSHHCQIFELDADDGSTKLQEIIFVPDHGWRCVEPIPINWLKWNTIWKKHRRKISIPIATKCKNAGLVDLQSSRTEDDRREYYRNVIDQTANDSTLTIVGRSLIDWMQISDEIENAINKKNLHVKIALLDKYSRYDKGVILPNGKKSESWVEKPIDEDWAMADISGAMARIEQIKINRDSHGTLEVYGLTFYVSHSFVAYTNKFDQQRYCCEEAGMALRKSERPMVELCYKENGVHSYGKALETMYTRLLTNERLLLKVTKSGKEEYDTKQPFKLFRERWESLGLADLAIGRENLHWKNGRLDDYLKEMPENGEIFMVGRTLVAWSEDNMLKSLKMAIESKNIKCTFVIADPTMPCLKSLVDQDYAQEDLKNKWPIILKKLKEELPPCTSRKGFLKVYGIPAYIPATFASYTDKDGKGFCTIEPGIGVNRSDRPIICFRQMTTEKNGNDIYHKINTIYRSIVEGKRILFSSEYSGEPNINIEPFSFRNALEDGKSRNGWFIGPYITDATSHLRFARNIEVKLRVHSKDDERTVPARTDTARTLSLLLKGKFQMTFPELDKSILMEESGDYIIYAPTVMHTWKVLDDDSCILTIRWLSECDNIAPLTSKPPNKL